MHAQTASPSAPMFGITPLLRPSQVEDAKSEIKSAEAKLASPHTEDKAEVAKQLRRLNKTMNEQLPRAPQDTNEESRMVARSNQLLSEILPGMCSQEEMRKAPPGAVDKHMTWEKRNKHKILEWKNLQLRLKPGEREAANLEYHRPTSSSLNMDNAVIPGKQIYIPQNVGGTVTFNTDELAMLEELSPELKAKLGVMNNIQRSEVKQALKPKKAKTVETAPLVMQSLAQPEATEDENEFEEV